MGVDLSGITLSPTVVPERLTVEDLLRRTGLFHESEISVAMEVLDIYLYQEGQEDYRCITASRGGLLVGYLCYGLNTMTEGTFELYWIAVDPAAQGQGVGSLLMKNIEDKASREGGRLMAVETSSRASYSPSRRFYRNRGYREEARVQDFYAVGDDKVIFVKDL